MGQLIQSVQLMKIRNLKAFKFSQICKQQYHSLIAVIGDLVLYQDKITELQIKVTKWADKSTYISCNKGVEGSKVDVLVDQDQVLGVAAVSEKVGDALDRAVLSHLYLVDEKRFVSSELKIIKVS